MLITIAICDDKKVEIENLYKEININFSKYASTNTKIEIHKYTEPHKLIEEYKIKNYDFIFLDIEMPAIDGFSVAEILANINPHIKIVFATSYDDLVYDSFKYTPVEFIRKTNLSYDMNRKGKYIFSKMLESKANYIFVQDNINIDLKLSDIIYIENMRNDIKIYAENDNSYILKRKGLKNFISEMKYENIIQIHTSYAVNIEFVYRPPQYDNIKLIKNEITLPVGRKYKKNLNEKFVEYARGFNL